MANRNQFTAHLIKCKTFAALLLFAAVNLVVSTWALPPVQKFDESVVQKGDCEARQQGKWIWWVTRDYVMQHNAPDIALFGSSQMGSATFSADAKFLNKDLDCTQYRRASLLETMLQNFTTHRPDTFNFALGGSMASDALMISRALFRDNFQPKLVVIGINPRDFMDNSLPSVSATEPFQFFSPYVDIGSLSSSAFSDEFAHLDWLVNRYVPLKRLRQEWQSQLVALTGGANSKQTPLSKPHTVHHELLQAVLGTADEVRKGEWIVPPMHKNPMFADNTNEYLGRYRSSEVPVYKGEMDFFRAFLSDMHDKSIKVLVVGMPSLWPNRALLPDKFWTRFRGDLNNACTAYQADFLDLTEKPDFVINDYLDTVHLNADGGIKLFGFISHHIATTPALAQTFATPNRIADRQHDFGDGTRRNASVGGWH